MKILNWGLLLLIAAIFQACFTQGEDNKMGSEIVDLSRSKIEKMNIQNVFLKSPASLLKAEWNHFDRKFKKQLLSKGQAEGLFLKLHKQYLELYEPFQNEDDDDEKALEMDMMFFKHDLKDWGVVYVVEQYRAENPNQDAEALHQSFWSFDGNEWEEITAEIPTLESRMFFDDELDYPFFEKNYILLSPSKEYENTLNARLLYERYEQEYEIVAERMKSQESYAINLIWNGQLFEIQRKPLNMD